MTNEISAVALLQSDFDRIDEEVDRIAMAFCEARLVELAQNRDKDGREKPVRDDAYKAEWHKLREAILSKEDGALVHLLYWLDVRADHWAKRRAPADDAGKVAHLLEHFANDAQRLQNLARRARDRQQAQDNGGASGNATDLYRNAEALHSLTHA